MDSRIIWEQLHSQQAYRRMGNFRVAFFRVRNFHAVNFCRVAFFHVRNVRAFNFRRLRNWQENFNGENFRSTVNCTAIVYLLCTQSM